MVNREYEAACVCVCMHNTELLFYSKLLFLQVGRVHFKITIKGVLNEWGFLEGKEGRGGQNE